ncbi:MAG: SGNH/GDSL hydrolase family protein [Planctomycetes bacterium]|nr:SGNH/GDSL hydrolase family protein [Planctomycetota bacterium]
MDSTVIINSLGYHDVERKSNRDNKGLHIAVIGDSFTAALEVPVSSTWTQVLEVKLNENTKSLIEVINLGMDGTGTDVHKNILEHYLQSNEVNVVILAFYENDIGDMRVKKMFREVYNGYVLIYQNEDQKEKLIEYINKNRYSHPVRWLYQHCYFFRAITNRRGRSRLLRKNLISSSAADINMSKYTKEECSTRIEETFLSLISLSHKHNFKLLVVPVSAKKDPNESMTALLNNVSQETIDKLDIINVFPVINDLLKTKGLKYHQLFWKYDAHFNLVGNRIFGTALAKLLNDAGWIQPEAISKLN